VPPSACHAPLLFLVDILINSLVSLWIAFVPWCAANARRFLKQINQLSRLASLLTLPTNLTDEMQIHKSMVVVNCESKAIKLQDFSYAS
jgi:hypothetical protein